MPWWWKGKTAPWASSPSGTCSVSSAIASPYADVWDVASKPLITVPENSSLYNARNIFSENRIRHLGVTGRNGELIGLIAYSDILASIEHAYVRELQGMLKEREERLNFSNRHLRLAEKVFETTFEGIMVTDAHLVIESINPAFTKITGYEPHEVLGKKPGDPEFGPA